MSEYGRISSRKDIRNRRSRRRRRGSIFTKFIMLGFIVIAVFAVILLVMTVIKNAATTEKETDDSVYAQEEEPVTEEETTQYVEIVQTDTTHIYDGERVVCIDAGHGGADSGAVGADGSYEKNDTLNLTKALKKELEGRGVTVYITRDSDVDLEREDRYGLANEVDADLFISLHRNSSDSSDAKGFETWVHSTQPLEATSAATLIQEKLCTIDGVVDRGVRFGSQGSSTEDLFINNHSKGPSCLIELGFISNSTDNDIVRGKQAEIVSAIADGVMEWMDEQGL